MAIIYTILSENCLYLHKGRVVSSHKDYILTNLEGISGGRLMDSFKIMDLNSPFSFVLFFIAILINKTTWVRCCCRSHQRGFNQHSSFMP